MAAMIITSMGRSAVALALLLLSTAAFAADPGMPMPPPPPTKPDYQNSYFHLSWMWSGNGFGIIGTIADPDGGDGVVDTGSLAAFESWALQSGANGPQWVDTGIIGIYAKGTITSSAPGYTTYSMSRTTGYVLPGDVKSFVAIVGNSASVPQAGTNQIYKENTVTWYGSAGNVAQKTGSVSYGTRTSAGATIGSSDLTVTFNGNPQSTSVANSSTSTTYTDATRAYPARAQYSDSDVETVAFSSGMTSSQITTTSSSDVRYYNFTNGDGSKFNALQSIIAPASYAATVYNQDGSSMSNAARKLLSKWGYGIACNTTTGTWRSWLANQSASGSSSSQVQGEPVQALSIQRSTAWDSDGSPSSWDGLTTNNGGSSMLHISWAEGTVTMATTDLKVPFNLSPAQLAALYTDFFGFETMLMEFAPPAYCYPYFPTAVPPSLPPIAPLPPPGIG